MKKNLTNINLSVLENRLRSDIMDSRGSADKFKMTFIIMAFPEGYEITYRGSFSSEISDFNIATKIFEDMKMNPGIFSEIQFRAYGYYRNNPYDGKYDILECFRTNGKFWRVDFYDK